MAQVCWKYFTLSTCWTFESSIFLYPKKDDSLEPSASLNWWHSGVKFVSIVFLARGQLVALHSMKGR